jgi:hypothetical protein
MFFRKAPIVETQRSSEQLLELWPHLHQPEQTLWLNIKKWDYKVFPSLRGSQFGSWMFQFEGICNDSPLANLVVTGDIEVLDDGIPPGMLSDHWENVPENVEGYGFLVSVGDASVPSSVGFTLYCKPSALEWIYRAFMVAGSGVKGGVSLKLNIDCPNYRGGDFWVEQWRSEWWRVVSWQLYAASQIHDR